MSEPSLDHAKEADYFGLVIGLDADKFAANSLPPVRSDLVDATASWEALPSQSAGAFLTSGPDLGRLQDELVA